MIMLFFLVFSDVLSSIPAITEVADNPPIFLQNPNDTNYCQRATFSVLQIASTDFSFFLLRMLKIVASFTLVVIANLCLSILYHCDSFSNWIYLWEEEEGSVTERDTARYIFRGELGKILKLNFHQYDRSSASNFHEYGKQKTFAYKCGVFLKHMNIQLNQML